jgi:hypothetical protein
MMSQRISSADFSSFGSGNLQPSVIVTEESKIGFPVCLPSIKALSA